MDLAGPVVNGRTAVVVSRDLAACIMQGALGATTAGGTLAACRAAGIRFLATGGVHRGFAKSLAYARTL